MRVTAFGLLATADVFTHLLAQGPTPDRLLASLPAIALVVTAYAVGGLLDAATGLVQSSLAPRVEMRAQDDLYTAIIGVDLVAFDDADFVELTNRASGMGLSQLRTSTTTAGDLLASLVSMAAAMITDAILHPLLAPVVPFSVLPQGWASIRSAKIQSDVALGGMQAHLLENSEKPSVPIGRFPRCPLAICPVPPSRLCRPGCGAVTQDSSSPKQRCTAERFQVRMVSGGCRPRRTT